MKFFLIFGDFNMGASLKRLPFMNECLPLSYGGDIANELINTLTITDLKQINSIRNIKNRVLDLVLTNCVSDEFSLTPATKISKTDAHYPPFEIKIS